MYLTYEEYKEISPKATSVQEDDFSAISSIASDVVDSYTFSAISRYGLMSDDFFADKIRRAVAATVDFVVTIGGLEAYMQSAIKDGRSKISYSVSVGNTSESASFGDGYEPGVTDEGFRLPPSAVFLLKKVQAIGRQIG